HKPVNVAQLPSIPSSAPAFSAPAPVASFRFLTATRSAPFPCPLQRRLPKPALPLQSPHILLSSVAAEASPPSRPGKPPRRSSRSRTHPETVMPHARLLPFPKISCPARAGHSPLVPL